MIIIETCPKCGHDLFDSVICTNPPIPEKECHNCGWTWEGKREEVIRIPFVENESPYATMDYVQNNPCDKCPTNVKNGGSGICHCILGQQVIY